MAIAAPRQATMLALSMKDAGGPRYGIMMLPEDRNMGLGHGFDYMYVSGGVRDWVWHGFPKYFIGFCLACISQVCYW